MSEGLYKQEMCTLLPYSMEVQFLSYVDEEDTQEALQIANQPGKPFMHYDATQGHKS